MSLLNVWLGRAIDLLLTPFRQLAPLASLAVVSLLLAVIVLLVFRALSNQRQLRAVRRQLQAAVFEMRLFQDDVRAVFRALGEALRHQATYLRLTALPLACTVVLLAPVVAHLQTAYGYEGLQPGRPALVTAQLAEGLTGAPGDMDIDLEAPAGIEVQTPAVWFPATREIVWRLALHAPGTYTLHVLVAGERFSKTLDGSAAIVRRSPVRPAAGVLNQLRYPAEPPLTAGAPLQAIRVQYPERRLHLLGWHLHWTVPFVGLTMLAAVALGSRLRLAL